MSLPTIAFVRFEEVLPVGPPREVPGRAANSTVAGVENNQTARPRADGSLQHQRRYPGVSAESPVAVRRSPGPVPTRVGIGGLSDDGVDPGLLLGVVVGDQRGSRRCPPRLASVVPLTQTLRVVWPIASLGGAHRLDRGERDQRVSVSAPSLVVHRAPSTSLNRLIAAGNRAGDHG